MKLKRFFSKMKKSCCLMLALILAFTSAVSVQAAPAASRTWVVLSGGSNNGNGHNYGNASVSAPLFWTNKDKTMVSGGSISMALRPSNNWGVFYSYIDDNNWLYVGKDPSSGWYYQYRLNGNEAYPPISGLPEVAVGEEMTMSITLNNETLSINVNGTSVNVTNQTLKNLAQEFTNENGNLGKFGVKTNGQTSIAFTDFVYNGTNCMNDSWGFLAERAGQNMTTEVTAMSPVTGTVTSSAGQAIEGATVRVGANSAVTDANGAYSLEAIEVGEYAFAVTKAGYYPYESTVTVAANQTCTANATLTSKAELDLSGYATIESDLMRVYIGKDFPVVARYEMLDGSGSFFRGNETALNTVEINGVEITPEVEIVTDETSYKSYELTLVDEAHSIDLVMYVNIEVFGRNLKWNVSTIIKNAGCARIATIDIPHLNLLSVDATEEAAAFDGAQRSTTTTVKADTHITWDDGFVPSNEDGYLYAFLSNGTLSAGLDSNSEIEGDKRVERINGADTMSLTSAKWYYESGDSTGQASAGAYEYPVSELPTVKVAISNGDMNDDGTVDWNDGAIAFRDIMHKADGTDMIKDAVNYRIVMNFESAAPNPFLVTADHVKKVYLATDGLPQALLLKGYGNEGHDSANSEYADIAEREGGVEDFQKLIEIAHKYNTEVGIHVNAQEAYPEARSFNETMISSAAGNRNGNGWGWLDQSVVINKLWDLASDARLMRFVQLYDRINGTKFFSGNWDEKEYVKDPTADGYEHFFTNGDGVTEVSREEVLNLISADAENRDNNMDFIYLDVWYQDAWETRRIAEEINSLGWRFSTEFSEEGEYDSTWQHWSTDAQYGGAGKKGYNSDIIRFLRNDQRDSQVLNHPEFGGTADNPLLGGFRLYGFEGWGGDQDFDNYIYQTFNQNLPTRFLQHYQVIDWENYPEGESPVGNTEKQITLRNDNWDTVVVTRNEAQRTDTEIERTITLNDKVVLNTDVDSSEYLLPWIDNQNSEEKLYHWNLNGGTTTWKLQDAWAGLENVLVYELSDQGRGEAEIVEVNNGEITLTAKKATAYVVIKGDAAEEVKVKALEAPYGEGENVADPGFNGYADGDKLGAAWMGDVNAEGVNIVRTSLGDQKLAMTNAAEDVKVATKLTGLTAGEDYVAEVYVENESDARAALTVNTGSGEVSVYTDRSIAQNTVSCDSEHGTKMNRMLVSFTAEGPEAALILSREAGEGYTHWDDIRIVEQKLNNYREDGSFVQDFESVVQGLYPFVLGYDAGGDSRTHLSQLNAPYTQAGWNGKATDDVLEGEWSLKHHSNRTGLIYRTIPQNFRFEPGKVYNVSFKYQTASAGYQMVAGTGTTYTVPTEYLPVTSGGTDGEATMQVVGDGSGQTWIGLYMNGSLCYSSDADVAAGRADFVLDNLIIEEDPDAVAVTIDKTDLFLGEFANIIGANLENVTWSVSEDGIVFANEAENKIDTMGTGNVTLTASYGEGKTETFEITVTDTIVETIDRSELDGKMTATANTEETSGGEPAPSGFVSAVVDGNPNTYWHSQWSGSGFNVSASNPAVITIDLGETMEIGGFRFQQRSQANRVITQYGYEIQDAGGNVLDEERGIAVPENLQQGLAWVEEPLSFNTEASKIVFYVEEVIEGGFGCLAEFEPIRIQSVATDAEITDTELEVGATASLEAVPVGGDMVKGLVWTSSDETVATVNEQGVVKGISEGNVTIKVSNSLGDLDTCTVTVKAVPEGSDTQAPQAPIILIAKDVTETSATLSWSASLSDNVVKYVVFDRNTKEIISETTDTSINLTNLTAGTTYALGVLAEDAAGNQSEAATVDVTTPGMPTPTPTETEVPQPTETEVPQPTETEAPQPTETEIPTPTETEVPQPTETEVPQPTETEIPQPTETEAPQPTETEVPQPTETEAPQPTETEVPQPTETEIPQPTETEVPQPTETEVPQPTETESPQPTETEVPQPTETEVPQPTETESPQPTETEAPQPTETEAPQPTETEAPQPTETPGTTVTPVPTGTPEAKDDVTKIFDDVYEDWYTEYIQYVYDHNLMTGIKGTKHFAPNENITKAQVAQVLYNMEGQPEVTDKKVFKKLKDVYEVEWYANAVAWAYNNSIVTGDLNTSKFSPNADVTREQLALMMFRYAKYKEYDVSQTSDFAGLLHAENVADWSLAGVQWAVGAKLLSGVALPTGEYDLAPQLTASRAQMAAILQRFCAEYK